MVLSSALDDGAFLRSSVPDHVTILDLRRGGTVTGRGTWDQTADVGAGWYGRSLATSGTRKTVRSQFGVSFEVEGGGTNDGRPGFKDTYFTLYLNQTFRGRGESHLIGGASRKFGAGDHSGPTYFLTSYGNCLASGDECGIGARFQIRQGRRVMTGEIEDASTDSGGAVTLDYRNAENGFSRGEKRLVIKTDGKRDRPFRKGTGEGRQRRSAGRGPRDRHRCRRLVGVVRWRLHRGHRPLFLTRRRHERRPEVGGADRLDRARRPLAHTRHDRAGATGALVGLFRGGKLRDLPLRLDRRRESRRRGRRRGLREPDPRDGAYSAWRRGDRFEMPLGYAHYSSGLTLIHERVLPLPRRLDANAITIRAATQPDTLTQGSVLDVRGPYQRGLNFHSRFAEAAIVLHDSARVLRVAPPSTGEPSSMIWELDRDGARDSFRVEVSGRVPAGKPAFWRVGNRAWFTVSENGHVGVRSTPGESALTLAPEHPEDPAIGIVGPDGGRTLLTAPSGEDERHLRLPDASGTIVASAGLPTRGILLWGTGAEGSASGRAVCEGAGLDCHDVRAPDGSQVACDAPRETLFYALCS